ncbi:MAG: anaerobic ribonucleoside-triphosphate reductase activating protein, partial [Anaerovoracaceae bacterium]
MHYGEIKKCDVANGIGVRVSLFVSGCTNHCKNCFQKETWDFDYGKVFDEEAQLKIIEMLRPDYIDGITVLGGEPFEPENQRGLYPFLKRIKEEFPDKSVWAYSGFTFE